MLRLLTLRATAVLNFVLRGIEEYWPIYVDLSATTDEYQEFARGADQLLRNACQDPVFIRAVAHRMPVEVSGVAWTTVSRQLLEKERCELQGFGAFSATTSSQKVVVNFVSSLPMSGTLSLLEPRDESEWFISKALFPYVQNASSRLRHLEQTAAESAARLPLLISEYLTIILEGGYESVLSRPFVEPSPDAKPLSPAFSTVSVATALAAYESWVLAFVSELNIGRDITLRGVGKFEATSDGQVRFDASEEFTGMLAANAAARMLV